MALVSCPECQKEVSTQALACPQCAFPFPGKRAGTDKQSGAKLFTCPDCACPVSKQAQSCPHCGVTLKGEKGIGPVNGDVVEETWLCTHCGTPYTKKVPQEQELVVHHQAGLTGSVGNRRERSLNSGIPQVKGSGSPVVPRKRPPLWQGASLPTTMEQEVIAPRYRRSRKKPLIVGFIIFVLLVASIGVGAFLKLQGLNPLEALVYWRM